MKCHVYQTNKGTVNKDGKPAKPAWVLSAGSESGRLTKYLGVLPKQAATEIERHVNKILGCNAAGIAYPPETQVWLSELFVKNTALYEKLIDAGFIEGRDRRTLGGYLEKYIDEKSLEWEADTVKVIRSVSEQLISYFGTDTLLTKITIEKAKDFRTALRRKIQNNGKPYAESTIGKIIKFSKQAFKEAVTLKYITENPFESFKVERMSNEERQEYVSVDRFNEIIDACNNPLDRLAFALGRWAGLRPSEMRRLKWEHVKFKEQRIFVISNKTKKKGKPYREIPIFPELLPFLQEVWENAEPNVEEIFPNMSEGYFRKMAGRVAKIAGVPMWQKPMQNLRSTRSTEIAAEFPVHVEEAWLGHSVKIAKEHYIQKNEEALKPFFDRAISGTSRQGGQKVAEFSGGSGNSRKKPVSEGNLLLAELIAERGKMPLNPVEMGNSHGAGVPAVSPCNSTRCNEITLDTGMPNVRTFSADLPREDSNLK
ncbi:MAG: tyrosine-type recombinase/integrase [Planctomycetaceae bacterium]|nr:tyrosine-type recombinase/integrase [Planctomycetaceae bacterium]